MLSAILHDDAARKGRGRGRRAVPVLQAGGAVRAGRRAAQLAMGVKVILIPLCIIISLVILHTKYTGRRQNDFNVYA